jgi:glycosyltransferase involved in cell wall biosynthesis
VKAHTNVRVLHLVSSCPTIGDLSHGIAVHRHARALLSAGHVAELAIVPEWLTGAGPFPRPDPNTKPAPFDERAAARDIDDVAVHVFDELDCVVADLLALALAMRPDVLHYHHSNHTELAHFIADAITVPVVYTAHLPFGDPRVDEHKGVVNAAVQSGILRADRFIVFVEAGRDRIARWLPEAAAKIRVVGHGVDDRAEIRALADARTTKPTITATFIGRFVAEKGIDDLIAAIPLALAACPALRFVLVGFREDFGTHTPGMLLGELGDAAARVRIEPWTSQAGIERELADADLLVSPSLFESFGMVISEAMLFGLPIVATQTEGASALLGPSGAGVLVPIGDPIALAEAIGSLARTPDLRLDLGRRGADYARRELGWPSVAAAMLEVYRECITG